MLRSRWRQDGLDTAVIRGLTESAGSDQVAVLTPNCVRSAIDPDNVLYAKSARMYDPPSKPLRPFDADYPNGAPSDAAGNLTHTIDGDPIQPGAIIAGRRVVGGSDRALSVEELNRTAAAITGQDIENRPKGSLPPETVGEYRVARRADGSGLDRFIHILNTLDPESAVRVARHEVGHAINDIAGNVNDGLGFRRIDKMGPQSSLGRIYNDLNTHP